MTGLLVGLAQRDLGVLRLARRLVRKSWVRAFDVAWVTTRTRAIATLTLDAGITTDRGAGSVICALRMRVNMSAMGSLMLISVTPTSWLSQCPGTSRAGSRIRATCCARGLNLLYTPRGRPVIRHRLRSRVGLALRGSACSFRRAGGDNGPHRDIRALATMPSSAARFFAVTSATSFSRLLLTVDQCQLRHMKLSSVIPN